MALAGALFFVAAFFAAPFADGRVFDAALAGAAAFAGDVLFVAPLAAPLAGPAPLWASAPFFAVGLDDSRCGPPTPLDDGVLVVPDAEGAPGAEGDGAAAGFGTGLPALDEPPADMVPGELAALRGSGRTSGGRVDGREDAPLFRDPSSASRSRRSPCSGVIWPRRTMYCTRSRALSTVKLAMPAAA